MGFTGVDIPSSAFSTALVGTPISTFTDMVGYFSDKFLYSIKLFFTVLYQSAVYDYLLSITLFVLIFWLVGYILREFIWFTSSEIAYYLENRIVFMKDVIFIKWCREALRYARMNFHSFLTLFSSRERDRKEDKKREENPAKAYAEGFRKAQDALRKG